MDRCRWMSGVLVGALAMVVGDLGEARAESVTLDEVLEQVPLQHETWEITEMQMRRSQALRRDAFARLLPQLNATGSVTYQGREVDVGDQTLVRRIGWGVGSTASIALFDGPAYFDYWRAGAEADATEQGAMWQRHVLQLDAELAFFTLASAQREVEIAEAALEIREEYRERAEALLEAGLAVSVDAMRARAEVLDAQQGLLEAEAALGDAADSLATLLGRQADGSLRADVEPSEIDVDPPGERASISEERVDFVSQRFRIEAAELGRRATWWGLAPRVELRFNTDWGPTTLFNPDRFSWSATVAATWNLYDGGGRYARADAAQADVRRQELELQRDLREADAQVARAMRQWRSTAAAIEVAEQRLEVAREVYDQEITKFEAGLVTSLEVSDASQELLNAELGLNQTRLRARLAEVQYRYLVEQ